MIKAILFDFDGTLADTAPGIVLTMQKTFEALGKDIPTEEAVRQTIGLPLKDCVQILGNFNDSEALALEYAARYPERIRVITTENGGLGAARNVGLEAARGEFVFFLDSDDRLADGALVEMLDSLTPERDIVIFDFLSVDTDGNVLERLPGCARSGAVSLDAFPELLMEYPSGDLVRGESVVSLSGAPRLDHQGREARAQSRDRRRRGRSARLVSGKGTL